MAETTSGKVPQRRHWRRVLAIAGLAAVVAIFAVALLRLHVAPRRSGPLEARMDLAAGEVFVEQQGKRVRAGSGAALLASAKVTTGPGSRALLRLSDGAALFLRGGTSLQLTADGTALEAGEVWLEVPAVDRKPGVLSLGEATVSAAESGLSIRRDAKESSVYVARGLAHVSAPGGRVEVRAGERALRTRPVPYPTAHAVRA
jgi:ferric-dicitrate binding protein FerR (iron transport regulator)